MNWIPLPPAIAQCPWLRQLCVGLLVLSLVSITGCGGCFRKGDDEQSQREREEAKKQKPKEDFESVQPMAMPSIMNDPLKIKRANSRIKDDEVAKAIAKMLDIGRKRHGVKVGHWQDIRFQAIANNFDFQGLLEARPISSFGPIAVPGTDFSADFFRPVSLPKGEWKTFETSAFFPPRDRKISSQQLQCSLSRGRGFPLLINSSIPHRMDGYQHHLVLLGSNPDAYNFLSIAPTIVPPIPDENDFSGIDSSERAPTINYFLIPTVSGMPVPLPRHSLNWTTTAYLLWDDLDPDLLDQDQQQGLVDWLHFGGQLILSGPDCLERLESSFLAPYLPAQSGPAQNLTAEDLQEFNQTFSLPEKNAVKRRDLLLNDQSPLLGVEFLPHETASEVVGSGGLVIERMLGRGRIVATAFSLKAPAVRSWRSFDSFLNNVLLRRPRRRFQVTGEFGDVGTAFADREDFFDPRLHSTLRYLSRDLRLPPALADSEDSNNDEATERPPQRSISIDDSDHWRTSGFTAQAESGVAAWNDFKGVSRAARATLLDAAGIAPPSGSLVLKLLIGYLIVLVPINWAIFRLLGKVEYAWVAAPIISIIGAVVVIRMASLDLGFSRSNIHIGVLEIQPDYHRGHLTDYAALYTSLSTDYRVEMQDPSAQSLPFPPKDFPDVSSQQNISEIQLTRTNRNLLEGLQIESNTTELLHTEQMLDVGGAIQFQRLDGMRCRVTNRSQLDLQHVAVIGNLEVNGVASRYMALLENLPADSAQEIELMPNDELWRRFVRQPVFANTYRDAVSIWREAFGIGIQGLVDVEQLREISEVEQHWNDYLTFFIQQKTDMSAISGKQFVDAYQELNPTSRVTLGRLLDTVDQSLPLAVNSFRLYGTTDLDLGSNQILPEATQSDRQTLIVVHLTRPELPTINQDINAPGDLGVESNVDFDREMELFNSESTDEDPDSGEDGN